MKQMIDFDEDGGILCFNGDLTYNTSFCISQC